LSVKPIPDSKLPFEGRLVYAGEEVTSRDDIGTK